MQKIPTTHNSMSTFLEVKLVNATKGRDFLKLGISSLGGVLQDVAALSAHSTLEGELR